MREGDIPGAPLECRCGVPPALLVPFDTRREVAFEAAVQRAIKGEVLDVSELARAENGSAFTQALGCSIT
jgi:hypothetical protein